MWLINLLPPLTQWHAALLDATLLLTLTFPSIYFLVFRQLNIQLLIREKAEKKLSEINCQLQKNKKELEIKNNTLQCTNTALMESENRYVHLFDFSPVGYLVISSKGVITEVNSTGAELFGGDKKALLKRNIDSFFPPGEGDLWHQDILPRILKHKEKQNCKLIIQRDDGTVFYALMHCQRENNLMSPNIRTSFTDITKQNFYRRRDSNYSDPLTNESLGTKKSAQL